MRAASRSPWHSRITPNLQFEDRLRLRDKLPGEAQPSDLADRQGISVVRLGQPLVVDHLVGLQLDRPLQQLDRFLLLLQDKAGATEVMEGGEYECEMSIVA